jgi:hypothetical protein
MCLQHQFWVGNTPAQDFWAEQVFKDVYSLQKLEANLQIVAFPKNPNDLNGHDPLSKVLGDGWEGFGEIFFRVFGLHKDVRVCQLQVSPPGQQGFDFTHKHIKDYSNGTIQAKYIGKGKAWEEKLRESEKMRLERYLKSSQNEAGVPVEATDNMIVFTNAKGIDYFTSETLLYDKVRCIGRPQITYLVDKDPSSDYRNLAFWDTARAMIMQTNPYIKF